MIHIDGDDDSDDVDQAPQLTTDERVMDDSTNVSSVCCLAVLLLVNYGCCNRLLCRC